MAENTMIKTLINNDWMFAKKEYGYNDIFNPEIEWTAVELPHDWLIYDTNNLYEDGTGLYKRDIILEKNEGNVYMLYFEGVYMDCSVYVNNQFVMEWKYGYTSFEADITEFVVDGCNTVLIKIMHKSPNTRWYSGAGIYRNVWLNIKNRLNIKTNGVYIHTKQEGDVWHVEAEADISNPDNAQYKLKYTVIGKDNKIYGLTIENPDLWDIGDSHLYTLKTELISCGEVVDTDIQKFGFRSISIDSNKGFSINGRNVKLNGVCEHHDLGALGAAFNKTAMKRKFKMLREMGVNAVRTSHNPPAVGFMELADEMGFLIVSEAFDMWERSKTEYDYARFFPEWHERDVESWIKRDRNRPSIIMWSIGNEVYDTHADERGFEVTKILRDCVKKHDPKKNAFITFGSNYMPWENSQKCGDELEASGYNYAERCYEEHHLQNPDRVIYGSETSSTVQSRGIYHFPLSNFLVTHSDKQCSALGNCCTAWGARRTEDVITNDRDAEFSLGQFIWTGFDYIGEPTPYTSKNSYFGQIDTAGFKKDTFFMYQAEWTDYKVNPMVHLLPYWDFNEGQIIDVRVYSNAPEIELFLNGKSLGKQEIDHVNGKELSGNWAVPYTKGKLKAVAYDENGSIIATDIQKSFGDAKSIELKTDKTVLEAGNGDIAFIEISVCDENNVYVANANNRIYVEVSGAGTLVGLDNGDSTDYDQFKGNTKRLFSGKLLAIVAPNNESGAIKVKVISNGLKSAEIELLSLKNTEIPIRKIELFCEGSRKLNPENKEVTVSAKIYPENASHKDVSWIAVNDNDIKTNIAEISIINNGIANISALGDGNFRLRAYTVNGEEHPVVISELEFSIEGMGTAAENPYEFVPACIYDDSDSIYKNGKLGGITIFPSEKNYIGFENVDFGRYGSDEITISIMFYDERPLPLEFWNGVPEQEGSELLLKTEYKTKPVWDKYINNTFKFPRKLTGKMSVYIAILDKSTRLDFQGFVFNSQNTAFEKIYAVDNTRIYGDSFSVTENDIRGIGNNVNIEFGCFDFDKCIEGIEVCGKSNVPLNTVHFKFVNVATKQQSVQLLEFTGIGNENSEIKKFNLDEIAITGKQSISLLFLPGSNFDLEWFRFIPIPISISSDSIKYN